MTSLEAFLILLAFGLVLVLWAVLYPRQRLMVSERGILDRELRLGWIYWDEIEGAYPPTADDTSGLHLKLRLTDRLAQRLRRRRPDIRPIEPGLDTVEVRLDLSEADIGAVELLHEILRHAGRPRADRLASS